MPSEYLCPRCNYSSLHKPDMRRHFNRKKICPDHNDLVLTSDIKDIVLKNRRYHIEKAPKVVNINNTNYNTFVHIINKMDWNDKIVNGCQKYHKSFEKQVAAG